MEEYYNLKNPLNDLGVFVADAKVGINIVNDNIANLPSMSEYIQSLRGLLNNIELNPHIYSEDATTESQNNYSADMSLSFPELLKLEGISIRVTSELRPGAKTKSGHTSHHSYKNEYGHSAAVDIVPTDGNFDKLKNDIYSNPRVVAWLINHNVGILEETTPDVMNKTGATGKHFHVGPDRWAIRMSSQYISYDSLINPSNKTTNESGKQRMLRAKNYLMLTYGLDNVHASALVGVWYAESRLEPSIKSKKDSGTGIAQWTGSRHQDFNRFYKQVFGRQSPGIANVGLEQLIDVAIAEYKSRRNNWIDFLNRNNLLGAVDSVLRGYENGGGKLASISDINRIYIRNGSGSYRKLMSDRLSYAQQALR